MTQNPPFAQLALIAASDAVATMSSREIAELTGKELSHVNRDIRAMLDALKDDPSLDHVREDKDARGYTTAFHLNRELTDTLLTGYSIPLRRKVVARWHELEAKATQPPVAALPDFSNPVAAARAWADAVELAQSATQSLAIAGPKAQALDRIAKADGDMCITNAAKDIGVQPRKLTDWMLQHKWIYRRAGASNLIAYQDRIQTGHLTHKVATVQRKDGSDKNVSQVIVTAKGLAKLAEVVV